MTGFKEESHPRGSVQGVPEEEFDPKTACKIFHDIVSGHGVSGGRKKETVIIDLITGHKSKQRQVIRTMYNNLYAKDLAKELNKHFGGLFSKAIYGLMLHPEEFLAQQIHSSVQGLGTDERKLIALLVSRTNGELDEMKFYYREKYSREMEVDVADDLSGDFETLLVGIMNATRNEYDAVDPELVYADAQALYEVRLADLGAREELFQTIFNARGPLHMRRVFDAYQQMSGGKLRIEETITDAFSGSLKNAYLNMIKSFRSLVGYNAERLHRSMVGPGTDDDTLMEILISRSEIDLVDIAECYEFRYKKPLVDAVIGDTSGDYRSLLTRLIVGEKTNKK